MYETVNILCYIPVPNLLHYFYLFLSLLEVLRIANLYLLHNISIVVCFAVHSVDNSKATLSYLALDAVAADHVFVSFAFWGLHEIAAIQVISTVSMFRYVLVGLVL